MPYPAFSHEEMTIIRRAFARQILAATGIADDPRLEEALASVPRERFVGAPPWQGSRPPLGYQPLPSNDPAVLYQDILIALSAEKGVNNGSPSLHARWLHALAPRAGERIVHIGAGTGYYTALIAHLVGERGHVTAVEFDPALAERARTNLADRPNVTMVTGDGAEWPREAVDGIYVNFSVERPARAWIEQLSEGGRLVFPLGVPRPRQNASGGVHALYGAGFCATRRGDAYAMHFLGPAFFVCAEGELSRSEQDRQALKSAFERGGVEFVQSLVWGKPASPQRCWFAGSGWALSYDEASA